MLMSPNTVRGSTQKLWWRWHNNVNRMEYKLNLQGGFFSSLKSVDPNLRDWIWILNCFSHCNLTSLVSIHFITTRSFSLGRNFWNHKIITSFLMLLIDVYTVTGLKWFTSQEAIGPAEYLIRSYSCIWTSWLILSDNCSLYLYTKSEKHLIQKSNTK